MQAPVGKSDPGLPRRGLPTPEDSITLTPDSPGCGLGAIITLMPQGETEAQSNLRAYGKWDLFSALWVAASPESLLTHICCVTSANP